VDVVGESQLVGSPPIPEWQIPEAQYPSVSLLNWTTVLKLLIDSFTSGDRLIDTFVHGPAENPICGLVDGHNGYTNITIQCATADAVISSIDFAAFGTPSGTCGAYQHNASCDAANVTQVVTSMCKGQHRCSVLSYPTFGDPCDGTYKKFIIQAQCSDGKGGYASPATDGFTSSLYAQAFLTSKNVKKVLIVNKNNNNGQIQFSDQLVGGSLATVDLATGDGPARIDSVTSNTISLSSYAVSVLTLP